MRFVKSGCHLDRGVFSVREPLKALFRPIIADISITKILPLLVQPQLFVAALHAINAVYDCQCH